MSAKMNWKKWRVGLVIAIACGLLTAGAGLLAEMSWKAFVAVLCTSLLTNLTNYLRVHPVEAIDDGCDHGATEQKDTKETKENP